MVARISYSKSISKVLNYNEQKVQQQKAVQLDARGFVKDASRLTFHDKLQHFERLNSLNEAAGTNTMHISLNFDPSELLSGDLLKDIANTYMKKIGFGKQPYLIYQHMDAGHPHIHIVTTNITSNGERINTHNLGRNQSERARKEIEIAFHLVRADGKSVRDTLKIFPVNAQKVQYGKMETKRAISNVLSHVLNQYKFSSFAELNAVLQLYNVGAEKGEQGSRIAQHNGLVYRILDEEGNKVGVPIKASAFYMKPTLKYLEEKFAVNQLSKKPYLRRLKTVIDWTLNKRPATLDAFSRSLQQEGVSVVLRKGKSDNLYGITYVDHKTKCVFNGSEIGKDYSAKGVSEKMTAPHLQETPAQKPRRKIVRDAPNKQDKTSTNVGKAVQWMTETVLESQGDMTHVPFQFKKKKKKRRRMSL